jgi:hypothetical protein
MRGQGLALVLISLAGAASSGWAQLTPVVFPSGGISSSDRWTNLTAANFTGYGFFPGNSAWPSPISSNQAGGGDAKLERLAGAPGKTGGPYPAGEGIYFGNMTQNANDPGGTLQVVDTTPVQGVRTIVFQIRIMEAMGHDFVSPSGIPQLYLNNELVGTSASYPRLLFNRVQDGSFFSPQTEQNEPLWINTLAFQWDLPASMSVSSFQIRFTGVTHCRIFEMSLDQSSLPLGTQLLDVPPQIQLLSIGVPAFDGTTTTLTHTFLGPAQRVIDLEYSTDLAARWARLAATPTGEGNFSVTFENPGDRRLEWSRRMFFRAQASRSP